MDTRVSGATACDARCTHAFALASMASDGCCVGTASPSTDVDCPPGCGDGTQSGAEECDDGNASNGDYCLTSCHTAQCGDSIVHSGVEACDDGNRDGSDACDENCYAFTLCDPRTPVPGCYRSVDLGRDAYDIAIGDADGDGHQDILLGSADYSPMAVYWGDGKGGFSQRTELSVGGQSRSVALADLNGDGRDDVVADSYTLCYGGVAAGLYSLLSVPGRAFDLPVARSVGGKPDAHITQLQAADFDADGRPEIIANFHDCTTTGREIVNASFASVYSSGGAGDDAYYAANLDADPGLELVVVQATGGGSFRNTVYWNMDHFAGGTTVYDSNPAGSQNFGFDTLAFADFDGDTFVDLLGSVTGWEISYRPGSGGAFGDNQLVTSEKDTDLGGPVIAHDYDADGKPDLLVVDSTRHESTVYFGKGDGGMRGTLRSVLPYDTYESVPHERKRSKTGDFNEDGIPDLVYHVINAEPHVAVLLSL